MKKAVQLLFVFLLLVVPAVRGCGCVAEAFNVPRREAIISEYCSSYNPDVFLGRVIAATCNCIPETAASPTSQPTSQPFPPPASSLNCQSYQLNETASQHSVNASLVTSGECDFARYERSFVGVCPDVENTLSGLMLGTLPILSDELLNLTSAPNCRYACPFNNAENLPEAAQPCVYTIRVMEALKGSYSADKVISSLGPDVLTSCGEPGRLLQLGEEYVAGIGQECSPIDPWGRRQDYTNEEMMLLRALREGEVECRAVAASVASLLSSTLLVIVALCLAT